MPEILLKEASKFNYFDDEGLPCEVQTVLRESQDKVWLMMRTISNLNAMNFFDSLADHIVDRYDIRFKDRRHSLGRRRSNPESLHHKVNSPRTTTTALPPTLIA